MNITIIRDAKDLPRGRVVYADVHHGAQYSPDELAEAYRKHTGQEPPETAYRFVSSQNVLIPWKEF